jgi:hypothetical protein
MGCIKWGCSRPEPAISEGAIQIVGTLLNTMEQKLSPQFCNDFFGFFGLDWLVMTFRLLIDSSHRFAFLSLMQLARRLIQLSEINEPLLAAFYEVFPDRQPIELYDFLTRLSQNHANYFEFKMILKEFLIDAKKISRRDPALFQVEREEIERLIAEKRKVPGLLPEVGDETSRAVEDLVAFVSRFSLRK